jgi:hypothetical protein
MATVRRGLPLALSTVVVVAVLAILMAVPARADDVTFFDTTDTVTAGTTGSRITIPVCGVAQPDPFGFGVLLETCVATLSAPSGSFFAGSPGTPLTILGDNGNGSDVMVFDGTSTTETVTFLSDLSVEGGIPIGCGVPAGCITENGQVQFAGSIMWKNPITGAVTTDNISFQSDAVEGVVPEPASLTLLGSGLLAIVGYIRRRLA